ncbi:hypothetical protein ABPG74_005834 [Tetrahymena malaccensis]
MYNHQLNLQMQKQPVNGMMVQANASTVGGNRPATSFGYKFYKQGEENTALANVPNTSQVQKQLPYHQKRTQTRTNSNKLPEITNIQGSAKKTEKVGNPFAGNIFSANNPSGSSGQISFSSAEFNEITQNEKDERFRYLLKHGTLKRIEGNGNIIFCELPQIMGIWVCYRRPCERETNLEKLNLDYMELTHMPLLEGEEKLKILTYQHNKISRIENLVSLPYLLYLDLYDNQVKEIEAIYTLSQLRVLLLPKNQITRIQQIDQLTKLEVLDLHSNKIQKIEGIKTLVNLKILNLANNLIVKLENLESQQNLVELNLKLNLIEKVENIQHLSKLEKLFLQNNRIDSLEGLKCLKSINSLLELNLEGNPVTKTTQQITYYKFILSNTVNLKSLDHKLVDLIREDLKKESSSQAQIQNTDDVTTSANTLEDKIRQQGAKQQDKVNGNIQINQRGGAGEEEDQEDEDINPEEVIEIIGEQWKLELNRVKKLELQNAKKKDYLQNILVEGGHAEIEDDTQLFIYGNAYEIVLSNDQFQEVIDKIQFQYIIFDFIIENQTLNTLKNFKKLKEIILKDNYLVTLLQLAKLEILPSLRSIQIINNPLQKCSFLKEFIVYRFPHIVKINGSDVKDQDKQKAKNLFSNFDRILQLPEKFYNSENIRSYPCENSEEFEVCRDKQYMKIFSKVAADTAEQFTQNLFQDFLEEKNLEKEFTDQFDSYILSLIDQSPVLNINSKYPLHNHHSSAGSNGYLHNKAAHNKTSHSLHSNYNMSSQQNTTSPTMSINSNNFM